MTTEKLSTDIREFLNRASTRTFLTTARQFVELLETTSLTNDIFFPKAHTSLLNLYAAGYALNQIDLKYSSADSDFDRDVLFTDNNSNQIAQLAGETFYREIPDPTYSEKSDHPNNGWTVTDKEASQGWLVDDFADIYRDLKIELTKMDSIMTDEAIEDALWQLKWSFAHHWGQHCINALRYFHYLYYEGKQTR